MRDRRALTLLALALASALCVATVELRTQHTGDPYYRFLVWNLMLAWVPLAIALAAYDRARRHLDVVVGALGVLWLLFFPNAPYMLTDFIHLPEGPAPLWSDALMLSSFAWTALLVGFVSLYLMQTIVRQAAGAAVAWIAVVGALALASVGVYVGRFIGFNSWDALVHPGRVAEVLQAHLFVANGRMGGALVVLTCFLAVAYGVLSSFAGLRLELERAVRC